MFVTGNPLRSEILHSDYKKSREKARHKKAVCAIFGGSLGADRINDTVIGMRLTEYQRTIKSNCCSEPVTEITIK